jgi:SnoaL-like domain
MSTDKNAPFTRATMGIVDGLPLTASSGGIEELRRDVQMLMDMEAIRQLKHRYFRCIDTANVAELAEIFHDDVEVHFVGGTYEWKLNGKAQYLGSIGGAFHNQAIGHHNAHHPEIQMLSPTEATAIWYLNDHMWQLDSGIYTRGTALYWDRYLKVDGRWLIRETRYRRIYEMNGKPDTSMKIDYNYLALFGSKK